jgi:hypothetical protein
VHDVYIPFIDGTAIRFRARQFDINLGRVSQEGKPKPKRFLYRDANGRETPIYLRLDQVGGRHNSDPCGGSNPRWEQRPRRRMIASRRSRPYGFFSGSYVHFISL